MYFSNNNNGVLFLGTVGSQRIIVILISAVLQFRWISL